MAHRNPSSAGWDLATWGIREWSRMVTSQPAFKTGVEWQVTQLATTYL